MANQPRPLGSNLWNTGRDIGAAVAAEGSKAFAEIGNTFQAVLYSGWSAQAAHRSADHNSSQRILEETAIAENAKSIEREPEIPKDGPARE